MTEQFANFAQTNLVRTISANALALTVANAVDFPTEAPFRITVSFYDFNGRALNPEVMWVRAVNGNVFTVQRAYEAIGGVQVAGIHAAGEVVAHSITAGMFESLQASVTGWYNFINYAPYWINDTNDATALLQNFLLNCQLQALILKAAALDDQGQRVFVTAYAPRAFYFISSPLVVPSLVNFHCDGFIIRKGTAGAVTSNYTGNTASQALANLYQPAVIFTPKSHSTTLQLNCNSNGADNGAGIAVGKTWTVASFAIGSAGKDYQVNDVLTCPNPDLHPYFSATATVTSVNGSGAITGISLTLAGAYGLPPVLQAQQWTANNGFLVFGNNGNFLTTGGNGSGATLTPTWTPDWSDSSTTYQMGSSGLIADTLMKQIRIEHGGLTTDADYGPMIMVNTYGLNFRFDDFEIQGGATGFNFNSTADIRGDAINCVGSENGMVCFNTSDFAITNVVVDTPGFWAIAIDESSGIKMSGRIFNRNRFNYMGSNNYTMPVGLFSSATAGDDNEGLDLDFQITNGGSGGTPSGNPALYLAYLKASKINLNITNYTQSTGIAPITSFATFGSGVDVSAQLTGQVDQVAGNLFSGTIPACAIKIWDAGVTGYCGVKNIYTLYGSGAPTSGSSGTGFGKAAPLSTYQDYTNNVSYTNTNTQASPTWTSSAYITTSLASGRIIVGNSSGTAAAVTMSGDAVLSNTGAITVSKTGGVAFATSATTDTTSASNITSGTLAQAQLPFVLRSYIAGLILSNDSGTPNTLIDITAGQATDSTNAVMMTTSSLTVNFGTTGANALDTGSIGSTTWYHVFLIAKTNGTLAGLASLSLAPSLPSGYSYYRRLGSVKTDGSSHLLAFLQDEETVYWAAPVSELNTSTLTNASATALTMNGCPPGVKTRPIIRWTGNDNVMLNSPDEPAPAPSSAMGTSPGYDGNNSATGSLPGPISFLYTNTIQQLNIRPVTNNATVVIYTRGYIDSRGRFA